MSPVIALLAFAGCVVHLAVIRHHVDYAAVAAGFALMGAAQWLFAVHMATKPSLRAQAAGVLLHTMIVVIWVLSRTIGLAIVPGAEDPAPVGLPDLVANLFAVTIIVTTLAMRHVSNDVRPRELPRVGTRLTAAIAVGVVALTVPAVLAGHDHAGRDHPVTDEPASTHDGGPVGDHGHDDHSHDHG